MASIGDENDAMEKGDITDVGHESFCANSSSLLPISSSGFKSRVSLKSGRKFTSRPLRQWLKKKAVQRTVNIRSLYSCPKGYPSLAVFLDSDENFMIYRRFGYVQARLLLEKQDELRRLEQKLDNYDNEVKKGRPANLTTRDLRPVDAVPRKELMEKLEQRFCEYANLMSSAQKLVALQRPASSNYASVENFIYNNQPLRKEEQAWIHCKEDLVTLRPGREHAWLDSTIEHILRWTHCWLIEGLFCSDETKLKTKSADGTENNEEKYEVYYTRSRIQRLVSTIITVTILTLLILPVYALYDLVNKLGNKQTATICIGVLLVFTLIFSAVLSLFTSAKRHEILGAAAAYCAVLVVFLSNVGGNNISEIATQ